MRFRKQLAPVPGLRCRPDIVFPRQRIAVFVDGCFWHRCPVHSTLPVSNAEYWHRKLERNVQRDRANDAALREAGWTVLRVWEHENPLDAAHRIEAVVRGDSPRKNALREVRIGQQRRQHATRREVAAAIRDLDERPKRVRAEAWPADLAGLRDPGLYSWWVDEAGARDLSRGLGTEIEAGRIYSGQAGATSWPSGKLVSATLGSRIAGNHLGGRVLSSTFRLTLAAALAKPLDLTLEGPKRLDSDSEARLTSWIQEHLEVAVHPFHDRDPLRDLEHRVLDRLEPPLNLDGRPSSELRSRLSSLRSGLSAGRQRNEGGGVDTNVERAARRAASVRESPAQPSRESLTLHQEIQAILQESGNRWMTTEELADAVNERGRYRKRDGSSISAFQVHGRTRNYPHIFDRDGSRVRLT